MKLGFLIDNRKCIGCHACTVACKQEHEIPLGRFRTWVKYVEKGEFPSTRRHFSVMRCNHCERPPCVRICPVTALFKRDDLIVDFDPEVCIGCKACMQACPYDALFIEPESGAAHKCNFCAHRIEVGLQPPCVSVCPEQAIVMGDLDDPASPIRRLMATEPTAVRAPEKATRPQLCYVEGDPASLVPLAAAPRAEYMWSQSSHPPFPLQGDGCGRRTYDVGHEKPWGWRVTAYLVTKSLSSGCFLAPGLAWLLAPGERTGGLLVAGTLLALFFLLVTSALLIADLKRPWKFMNIVTRPQWASWLAIGSLVLIGYGAVLAAILGATWWASADEDILPRVVQEGLVALGLPLAGMAAMYTGWLFAQCEGRDLWRSPQLPWHLLSQAVLAGASALVLIPRPLVGGSGPFLIIGPFGMIPVGGVGIGPLEAALFLSLCADLVWFFPHELGLGRRHRQALSEDARRAARVITGGAYRVGFWAGVVGVGHVLPMLAILAGWTVVPAILALAGLALYEHCFITAGQAVPLS